MDKKLFLKIIQAFEVLVLILLIASIYSSLLFVFQKPPVVVTKPVTDTTDWLVENKIEKPVVGFINGINPDAKIEFEKFEIPPEFPISSYTSTSKNTTDSFDTSLNLYRKKITLDTQDNLFPLKNYVLSITLDTLALIRESKISFTCDQIYFTDDDGKTVISHWIDYGCGKEETKFWIRVPKINPKSKKIIFVYYGNDTKYTYSNFKTTFLAEKDLVGWYYFEESKSRNVIDKSGKGNNGLMSSTNYSSDWGDENYSSDGRSRIFFNDWKAWGHRRDRVYFTLPSKVFNSFIEKGSIEIQLHLYNISQPIDQHFLIDTNQQIELGFSHDGNIFFQNGKTSNRVFFNTNLKKEEWYQIICTWDFSKKSIILYLDGKQINQLPQKIPFKWKHTKSLGDLKIGGYNTIESDYGFVGFLDGLQIYNKQLSKLEAMAVFNMNKTTLRFSEMVLGKEEKLISKKQSIQKINFLDMTKYPKSNKVKVNLIYASPFMEYRYQSQEELGRLNLSMDPPLIIDRTRRQREPIFGFGSHFYPHIGTQILINDNLLNNYVGLRINNLSLIKNLKINFAKMIDNSNPEINKNIAFFDFLMPNVNACGSFYYYKNTGESNLEFYCTANGIAWYKLSKPIFVEPTTSVMQIEYEPTNKVGELRIQLSEMLFVDQENRIFRSVFFQKDPEGFQERKAGPEKIVLASQYRASLMPIEKGFVDFQRNKENGLDLVIGNQGYDKISLSFYMFNYWQENLLTGIQIFNNNKQQILNISVEDIKKHIMNQELDSSYLLHFPIIDSQYIPKNNTYYITFTKPKPIVGKKESEPTKLISWILSKDPYIYFYKTFEDKKLLYELVIDKVGNFNFNQPKEE